MLTLQALTYIGGSRMRTGKPTDILKGPDTMGKCTPLQAEKQPELWRASTTDRNISLHKDELSLVNLYKTVLFFKMDPYYSKNLPATF